jgi:dihydrofolate reductase
MLDMGKIILHLNITPNGFCDHRSAVVNIEMMKSVNEVLKSVDKAIFGRTTFQLFERYWPMVLNDKKGSADDIAFAGTMENMEKIVFSKTLTHSDWKNSRFLNELNKPQILKITEGSAKDIIIFGSPGLASQLIELDLVDEYYFLLHPVVMGAGPRLSNTGNQDLKRKLHYNNAQIFDSGAVVLWYSKI